MTQTDHTQFKVEDMSCEKCAARVRSAVLSRSPSALVDIDLPKGLVTVTPAVAEAAAMAEAISEAGYPATLAN